MEEIGSGPRVGPGGSALGSRAKVQSLGITHKQYRQVSNGVRSNTLHMAESREDSECELLSIATSVAPLATEIPPCHFQLYQECGHSTVSSSQNVQYYTP